MEKKEKINLKRLNSVLKKNSIKILVILFLFTIFGYFYSYKLVTPKYKSTSTILLASNNLNQDNTSVTQTEVTLNKNLISTYGKILTSNNVLEQVISSLNLDMTREELYKNIQIQEVEDTQIIQISVIAQDAVQAQKIANELNNVFIEEIKQIYKMENIKVVDQASLEVEPYNINHIRDILIFFCVGLLFSACVISVIFLFDTTIKIEQDIEEFANLNVIGTVPKCKEKNDNELAVQDNSKSVVSEALKTIRTNLSFAQATARAKTILFTSCNVGEGKSWISANMAVAYAQSNQNVIVVDADLRKGRQHNIFNTTHINGLSSCLKELQNNQDFETLEKYIQETKIPKVHIITSGAIPPNPSELLLSDKMKNLVDMLKCIYDVVIIDGTPCNLISDSIPVSSIVDTTVIVTESRKTKIEDLNNVVKSIKNANGNIIGAILNKKELKGKEYGKGYYYGDLDNNSKIEVTSYTVKELIANRKEYTDDVEKVVIEEPKDNSITLLDEKIQGLENKLTEFSNMNTENYNKIVEEVKQLNYDDNINSLDSKLSTIEQALNDKTEEEKLINIIAEVQNKQNEQNSKIEKLDESNTTTQVLLEQEVKKLIDTVSEMNTEQNLKIEQLNYDNDINSLNNKLNIIEETINSQSTEEKLINIIAEVKNKQNEQNSKIEQLDKSNMTTQDALEQEVKKLIDAVSEMNAEQNLKMEQLNYDSEINSLNNKLNNIEENINNIDNTKQIKEIMKELKKTNNKYEKLSKTLNEINTANKEAAKANANRNNIIELNTTKKQLKPKEIIIEFGKEVAYEELLDLAVGTYDINPNQDNLKRSME